MNTAWDDLYKFPTDGPYPNGWVRVGGVRLPMRIFKLQGAVVPVPWEPQVEQAFRRWFELFAKSKGWPMNPDHDRYEIDWRAAWWAGFRGTTDEALKTTSGPLPEKKIEVFMR